MLTSVRIRNLYVPANALRRSLHKFGRNLVLLTNREDYQFQLIGSAAGLRYHGKCYLVCTAHQINQIENIQNVGIILHENNRYNSSAGFSHFIASSLGKQSDAENLSAFDFTPQAAASAQLARRFFDLTADDFLSSEDDTVGYLAFGCPFMDQLYHIFDDNHLGMVIRSITCEPLPQPSDAALGSCRAMSPMDFDPDWLSGGPVFAIVFAGNELARSMHQWRPLAPAQRVPAVDFSLGEIGDDV